MESKTLEQNLDDISLNDVINDYLVIPIKKQFKNNKEYIVHLEKEINKLSEINHIQNEKISELESQLEYEKKLWKQLVDKIDSLDWGE